MKSVLVIDDHPLLSTAVANALNYRGIAQATTLPPEDPDLRAKLCDEPPDLCLCDLYLGGHYVDDIHPLRMAVDAGIEVAMLTGSEDDAALGRCIEAGAVGVILKQNPFSMVIDKISALLQGTPFNSDNEILRWVLAAQRHANERHRSLGPFTSLTQREQQVLRHLMNGTVVDEIATADFVSPATVRSQVRAILQKLGVRSQLAAVAAAHRTGWTLDEKDQSSPEAI